jgi:hypothetical protein
MRRNFMTSVLFLGAMALKGLNAKKETYQDIARLKMSLMYVKSVETFRLLFVSLLGVGLCLTLLSTAIVLFHITSFLYAPWTDETKMWFGFAFSGFYLLAAVLIFNAIFAQAKWLKIFHADGIKKQLAEECKKAEQEEEYDSANGNGRRDHQMN